MVAALDARIRPDTSENALEALIVADMTGTSL